MKVAIVGATGMVGQVMLKVLSERNFPLTELIPVASERSVGNKTKPILLLIYKRLWSCALILLFFQQEEKLPFCGHLNLPRLELP